MTFNHSIPSTTTAITKVIKTSPGLSNTGGIRCLVCDEGNAAKHYGSYCCSGCKGFFRRSARFQRVYICPFDNSCNITQEFRNGCRACRYKKCLSVGLNPLLVHSDRGSVKTDRKRKESQVSSSSDLPSSPDASDGAIASTSLANVNAKLQLKNLIKNRDQKLPFFTFKMPSSLAFKDINLPLGSLNLIGSLSSNDAAVVAKYYATVEKILDNFKDTEDVTHICESFEIQLNITAAEVCDRPSKICRRTKLDWTATKYVTGPMFNKIWARTVLSYFDWASFIPELRDLSIDDRNLLLVNRAIQSVWALYSHRSAVTNAPGILLTGGCFFPRDKDRWPDIDPEALASTSNVSDMVNMEIIDEMRRLKITDEEFAILRVLCFFTAVPQLSKEGYDLIQQARRKYASILAELIRIEHASRPFTEIIDRINRFMLLLPIIEKVTQIDDESLGMMIVFNMAEMKSSLSYELHIGKNATPTNYSGSD